MTKRSFQVPDSFDVPIPTSPKAASNTTASSAIKNDHEPEAMPASQVIDDEEANVSLAKDGADKIASCEDKGLNAPDVGKSVALSTKKKEFTPYPAVQAAIDRCLAVRDHHGSFIGWGERSEATASAALALVALMTEDHNALTFVRKQLNKERKDQDERALNNSTGKELLAVFMCALPKTKADRQECSRFANVISVAVAENRTPENVGMWLKATTLSDVLEKARARNGKPSSKNYSVAITRSKYPEIWANFQTEGVREAIEKALLGLNKSLKNAGSDAS